MRKCIHELVSHFLKFVMFVFKFKRSDRTIVVALSCGMEVAKKKKCRKRKKSAVARHKRGTNCKGGDRNKKRKKATTRAECKEKLKAVEAVMSQLKSKSSATQGRAAGEPPKTKTTTSKRERKPVLKMRKRPVQRAAK